MVTWSVPNTIQGTISSAPVNGNFSALVSSGNAHDTATTGVHGMGAGTLLGTTLAQTVTGRKTFSGADSLILPTSAPTMTGSVGLVAGALQFWNGSSAVTTCTTNSAQTITGAKTFSGANTLIIPTTAPTATAGSVGLSSNVLQIHDGSAARSYARLDNTQTFTGAKTFSGANTLVVPTSAPTTGTGSVGVAEGCLQFFDGSARYLIPAHKLVPGAYNIGFSQGADSSVVRIRGLGASLSATNPGFVVIRSATASNGFTLFTVTADVDIDLTGAHWGLDGAGNLSGIALRVYAINDAGTLRWGICLQGGFTSISSTQETTTAASVTAPETFLTNSAVGATSKVLDIGYVSAGFTDASNEWVLSDYFPGISADGVWMNIGIPATTTGFSAVPTSVSNRFCMVGNTVFWDYRPGTAGTSNATGYTVTLPIKSGRAPEYLTSYVRDNSTTASAPGVVSLAIGSITATFYRTMLSATWTNANEKSTQCNISYEAYQP